MSTTRFGRIGARRVVNGVGPATRLGGVPLHPTVIEAMAEATGYAVRMDDLERRAGQEIADLIGVEAAYVTSGAAAGLTLATAALIAGRDPALADALPLRLPEVRRVVVLAAHRDPYDRAIEAAGAELVTVGYPAHTHLGEIERVLDDGVVAVLYRPGRPGNHPSLAAICDLADRHGVPVLIDGALYAPPLENVRRWMDEGAGLVAMSGGKHLRGPQATGILCGRRRLLDAVAVHHQDMDERESTWHSGDSAPGATPPRHGIGRAMKVGREQIAGLLAAVERYAMSPGIDDQPGISELERLAVLLAEGPLPTAWHPTSALGVPVLELDLARSGADVDLFVSVLRDHEPSVFLEESEAWRGVLVVNPMALIAGDADTIAAAVASAWVQAVPPGGVR